MRIKTRILLGYVYLVGLLLAAAVGASVGFYRLSSQLSEAIENGSVGTGPEIELLQALEMEHDLLVESIPGGEENRAAFEAARADFRANLETLQGTSRAEERDLLRKVAADNEDFERVCDEFFSSDDRGSYHETVFPAFVELRSDVMRLIDLTEENLMRAEERLRIEARRRAMGYAVLVIIALLSLVVISRVLQETVLDRLDELRRVVRAIGRGDLRLRASVRYRDELGLVAERINDLLDQWQEAQRRATGDVAAQNQLILAVVERWPEPVAIVRRDGRLLVSTLPDEDTAIVESVTSVENLGDDWIVDPLVAPGDRPVGFMIRKGR